MRKIVFCIIISLMQVLVCSAGEDAKEAKQLRADIAAAKAALKNATDIEKTDNNAKNKLAALERSEQTMRGYLAKEEYGNRKDLHLLLIDLVKKQYEAGNMKMYLKIPVDTSWYIQVGKRMFQAIERFDSVDAQPDEKGVSDPSYRKRHSEFLSPYRRNMMRGGMYYNAHKKWSEAWECLDLYLSMRHWPLFENTPRDSMGDTSAAYFSLVAAVELKDLGKAKKYIAEALQHRQRKEMALKMMSMLCEEKGDSSAYEEYLLEGVESYPTSEFFFSRLIDFYTAQHHYKAAESFIDKAIALDSTNTLFLLAKHSVLMVTKRYDDAMLYARKLQSKGDTLSILDYNIGYIYYEKAQEALKQTGIPFRIRMKNAQSFYKQLLPYMERYQRSAPDKRDKWYPILYEAYLNLNLGKQFDALNGK